MANDDDIRDMSEAPQSEQDHMRDLVRRGQVTFSPEAIASMKAKGLTEDQVLAMFREAIGMKPN